MGKARYIIDMSVHVLKICKQKREKKRRIKGREKEKKREREKEREKERGFKSIEIYHNQ